MDVVAHQTKSMYAVAKLFVPLLKQTIKIFLVLVFEKNILPGIPPEENVVYGPRVEKTWFPCHGVIIIKLLKLSSLTPKPKLLVQGVPEAAQETFTSPKIPK